MVFFSPTIAAKRASTSGDIVRSGSSRRCRGEGGFIGSILGVVDVAGECICFRRRLKGCLMLPGQSFHAILPGLGVGGITHEACTLYEGIALSRLADAGRHVEAANGRYRAV